MKKLTKILAIILCMAMMFTLCACGKSDTEKFIGTWEAEVDMTDALLEGMESELGDDVSYFEFDKLIVIATFIFKEDGTYKMEMALSDESVERFYSDYETGFRAYMDAILTDEMASYGLGLDDADELFLEVYGMTFAEYIDAGIEEIMAEVDIQDLFADFAVEGKWKALGGKLFMTEDIDDDFKDASYDVYEDLTENGFKLVTEFEDGEEDLSGMYPMTFKRVK